MAKKPSQPLNIQAAFLAWLWPGLGHLNLGHRRRGFLIMFGTLFLLLWGILVGGIDSIDRRNDTLWFCAQAGCGPIAFVVDAANEYLLQSGRVGRLIAPFGEVTPTFENGVARVPEGTVNEYTGIAHVNEFGTLFSALAGLMNISVILDALVRPRLTVPETDRRRSA